MLTFQGLYSSTMSLNIAADNHILGRGMFETQEIGKCINKVRPLDLSLFKLGILVNVIHQEAPTYSVLNNQCYWFVGIIIEIIVLLYGDGLKAVSSEFPMQTPSPSA